MRGRGAAMMPEHCTATLLAFCARADAFPARRAACPWRRVPVCPRVRRGGRRLTHVKAAIARAAIIPKGWTASTSADRA
ncbi:hypothetical protein BURPS406E_G0297 [Burkholderia pseudomallei 406e]|uniref:Uncharacterized protein n=1 Tax=Burkholderia mallei (strain NCTC 10229) TaxID=412022 RepID=A2RY12_BURM9|nr:hypothetical protein BMA10229_0766 [Burkholderia mallei NCTC 10229]EDK52101.1 hypothetical protein BMAFMH_I0162 [Burkholderia mallei FMH]EDK57410.1 hypothetical protein BMAJHU_F0159 [Burkholderia mallei JHU]EDK82763.1 hypothetical protein BMA721280_K0166 [Burkholderia mallei 2002721280]EDO87592.1 hypothetical protein BURPS406E_G0297 [Burkholderia pseudomallei 406e]EDP85418.1 hypothetical protein BMA10399_G0603 [Burkholderia mallei ATCC 10399]EDS82712.1 hypothetical protein BURPSS13_T0269 [